MPSCMIDWIQTKQNTQEHKVNINLKIYKVILFLFGSIKQFRPSHIQGKLSIIEP